MNLILIGAQGSGKGTQAQVLADQLRLKPTARGELLGAAIAKGTPAGKAAQPYYDRGDLVPDEIVVKMILEDLENLDGAHGIILDGFPRTIPQARALDQRLSERGQRIDYVIYLEVPKDILAERLAGRYVCTAYGHVWNILTRPTRVPGICDYDHSPPVPRSDDTPEKNGYRLAILLDTTINLLAYYH